MRKIKVPPGMKKSADEQLAFFKDVIASSAVTDGSLAIDGGANVGTWSRAMAGRFSRVFAFEPAPDTFENLFEAMSEIHSVECFWGALMNRDGWVEIRQPPKSTSGRARYVESSGPLNDGAVRGWSIDGFDLNSCGLIKLDLEGAEYLALKGAVKTIARCRPLLMVEMWFYGQRFGNTLEDTEALIANFGYRELSRCGADRYYVPAERQP